MPYKRTILEISRKKIRLKTGVEVGPDGTDMRVGVSFKNLLIGFKHAAAVAWGTYAPDIVFHPYKSEELIFRYFS